MSTTSVAAWRWTAAVVGMLALSTAAGSAQAGPTRGDPRAGVATGTFSVTEFSIVPYQPLDNGSTLNRFQASDLFQGGLTGTGSVEAQMLARADGSSDGLGFIHFVGSLHGRQGSFVLKTVSSSDGDSARASWIVLEGTGTGELTGLKGWGSETAVNNDGSWSSQYKLTYRLG